MLIERLDTTCLKIIDYEKISSEASKFNISNMQDSIEPSCERREHEERPTTIRDIGVHHKLMMVEIQNILPWEDDDIV